MLQLIHLLHCEPSFRSTGRASRHAKFTGPTRKHVKNCRAIDLDPWWTDGRRTNGASHEEPRPPARRARGGLIRPRGDTCADTGATQCRDPTRTRRLSMGPSSCFVAELHIRTTHRAADPTCRHHA